MFHQKYYAFLLVILIITFFIYFFYPSTFLKNTLPVKTAHAATVPQIGYHGQIQGRFFQVNITDNTWATKSNATPVFTQTFPVIDFNTNGWYQNVFNCTNHNNINANYRPITDLYMQVNRSCNAITVQGNGKQAGSGALQAFDAVFTGSFEVTGAGDVTFNYYSDDGWILSIGKSGTNQPTYVSNHYGRCTYVSGYKGSNGVNDHCDPNSITVRNGPFTGYPMMGMRNSDAPGDGSVTVHFPAAGVYPFEDDYFEVGDAQLNHDISATVNGVERPLQPVNTISGNVFVDSNLNGIKDGSDANYTGGITIRSTGGTVTKNASGSYTISNLPDGTYTVTYTLPAGYYMTYPTNSPPSFTVTVGLKCASNGARGASCTNTNIRNLNFGIHQLYSVTGNIFSDANRNGKKDTGENNYAAAPSISTTKGTVTTNANGSYMVSNIPAGAVTIRYNSLPAGYYMTSPLNGPPPSFTVTVGPNAATNAPGANACGCGNITNLNFGITNTHPWFQSTCGDVRNDNGIADLLPGGVYANITNASCTNPGISFTGDTDATYGSGQDSTSNEETGGSSYPEVFSPNQSLETSYSSLLAKAQNATITPVNLASMCTLSNCTLPNNLAHGIYLATGDVTLNATNFKQNANYVILINGNLTIRGTVSVPDNSTVMFSTTKDITVAATVGRPANNVTSSLDGWYIAGQNFIVNSAGNCNDLRLNIAGTVVANATGGGGTFQNNRDLCGNDTADPTVTFTQRLDMILNAPQFLKQQQTISQELAP